MMICKNGYKTIQGFECLNAGVSNYIHYRHNDIISSDIFFGGDGMDISYIFNSLPMCIIPVHESNFIFMDRFGINYQVGNAKNFIEAERILENAVWNNKGIIITVYAADLIYNSVFNQANEQSHCINVVGSKGDFFYISDGFVPTYRPSMYQGWLSKKIVYNSWKKMKFEYCIVDFDEYKNNSLNIIEIAGERRRKEMIKYIEQDTKGEIVYGIDSLKYLLNNYISYFEPAEARNAFFHLNFQIKVGGFMACKRFLLESIMRDHMNENIIREYNDLIKKWDRCCLLIIKAGIKNSFSEFDGIRSLLLKLIDEEKYIIGKMLLEK